MLATIDVSLARAARVRYGGGVGTAVRYVALQAPGWLVAAAVAWALWTQDVLGGATAFGLVTLWILKDAALYPYLRRAYEPSRPPGDALVGREVTARTPLAPDGWVRVGAELWRARLASDAGSADAGAPIVIEKVEGLTLVVRPKA